MQDSSDTILVTGGAGFIGSGFVRRWLAEETSALVNLDKLTYAGHLESLASVAEDARYTFAQGDVADRPLVADLLEKHRPRAVVHLAAETHVDRSIDAPPAFLHTNVTGTFELLDACCEYWQKLSAESRKEFRFLHASTDEVFGEAPTGETFNDQSPYAPNSPYAASKAAGDQFVRAYWHTYGLPTILIHSSNTYGPYQYPEKLIPLMICRARQGQSLPVYGDGLQIRDWLHVEDHVAALCSVLASGMPGERYLVGGGNERTNLEIVEAICQHFDRFLPRPRNEPTSTLITHVADRPGHDVRYAVDSSRLREQIGWQPQHKFEQGLEQAVRWYLENEAWIDAVTTDKETTARRGLGDGGA